MSTRGDIGILHPTSISMTALDSLNSKLSAIDAGWLDDGLRLAVEEEEKVTRAIIMTIMTMPQSTTMT